MLYSNVIMDGFNITQYKISILKTNSKLAKLFMEDGIV